MWRVAPSVTRTTSSASSSALGFGSIRFLSVGTGNNYSVPPLPGNLPPLFRDLTARYAPKFSVFEAAKDATNFESLLKQTQKHGKPFMSRFRLWRARFFSAPTQLPFIKCHIYSAEP